MMKKSKANGPTRNDFGLWRLLDHTRFMIARAREMELAKFNLTPEQSHVLYILSQKGGTSTINEIVEITMRQHHSISTLINRMTRQGLVKKIRNPNDYRKYDVVATEKGQNLIKKVTQESINMTFTCLSEQDKKELETHLRCLLGRAYSLQGKELRPQVSSMQ